MLGGWWLNAQGHVTESPTRDCKFNFYSHSKNRKSGAHLYSLLLPSQHRGDWKPDISYLNELPPISHFSPLISVFIREGEGERYVLLLLHIKYICIFYDDSLGVSLSSDLTRDDDG